MKNILKALCLFIGVSFSAQSCDDWTEMEANEIQSTLGTPKSEEFYKNLRAYKQSKHTLSFGWFGFWNGGNSTSARGALRSAPDSMDIIALWGTDHWANISKTKQEDLKYVQEVKGTKVVITTFAHSIPIQYYPDDSYDIMDYNIPEGVIETYAKALNDTIQKYGYDGIDFDYEPGFGGRGPLIDRGNMEKFIREMSKYVGPASNTGKLLIIDGVPGALNQGLSELFDYGIVQAYSCYSASDLQRRFNAAASVGWRPDQYIFTENFEAHWKTGGVNFRDVEGNNMPSLIGMALFNPEQGEKAGFGAYHMEYEYPHTPDYKYMRMAIQMANPAKSNN